MPAGLDDLAALKNGALALACSDAFFGPMNNLLLPGRAENMGDGWETRRRRGPGHDWILIKLAARGTPAVIEVDTNHFKGNFPDRCSLEAIDAGAGRRASPICSRSADWSPLLPETRLGADARHFSPRARRGRTGHARAPQHLSRRRREPPARLGQPRWLSRTTSLNAPVRGGRGRGAGPLLWRPGAGSGRCWRGARSPPPRRCTRRPSTSGRAWGGPTFSRPSRIIRRSAPAPDELRARFTATHVWASQEQARVQDADERVREALRAGNVAYQRRFGFIFIVCATGKSGARDAEPAASAPGQPARARAGHRGRRAGQDHAAALEKLSQLRHEPHHLARARHRPGQARAGAGGAPRDLRGAPRWRTVGRTDHQRRWPGDRPAARRARCRPAPTA